MPCISGKAIAILLALVMPFPALRQLGRGAEISLENSAEMIPKLMQQADLKTAAAKLLDLAIEHFSVTQSDDARPAGVAPPPPGLLDFLRVPAVKAAAIEGANKLSQGLKAPDEQWKLHHWASQHFGSTRDVASLDGFVHQQISMSAAKSMLQTTATANATLSLLQASEARDPSVPGTLLKVGGPLAENIIPTWLRQKINKTGLQDQGVYGNVGYWVINRSFNATWNGWAVFFKFEPTWSYKAKENMLSFETPVSFTFTYRGFTFAVSTAFQPGWWLHPSPAKFKPRYLVYDLGWYHNSIGPSTCSLCRLSYGGGAYIQANNFSINVDASWDGREGTLNTIAFNFASADEHQIKNGENGSIPTFWVGPAASIKLNQDTSPTNRFLQLHWSVFEDLEGMDDKTEFNAKIAGSG